MAAFSTHPLSPAAVAIVFGHALLGWAWCGALVGVGQQLLSMQATLIVHAIGAPLGVALIAFVYFSRFGFTGPLASALIFVGVAIAMDVFIVALLIEHSFAMFASPRGTWLPLSSVFAVTLAIGIATRRRFARELMRATVEDRDAALQGLR